MTRMLLARRSKRAKWRNLDDGDEYTGMLSVGEGFVVYNFVLFSAIRMIVTLVVGRFVTYW